MVLALRVDPLYGTIFVIVLPHQEVSVTRRSPQSSTAGTSQEIDASVDSDWGRYTTILFLVLFGLFGGTALAQGARSSQPTAAETPIVPAGCSELIVNGGFEVDAGWRLNGIDVPPAYVTSPVFAGQRAMRLGIADTANAPVVNSVEQTIALPPAAGSIVLGFHYFPVHEEGPGDDLQFLDLYDTSTGAKIQRIWAQLGADRTWRFLQFDLTSLKGKTIRLLFGVINDGGGGRTSLYLDDVSLLACDVIPTTATITATATPTGGISIIPTPTPTGTPLTGTPTVTPSASPTASTTATQTPTATPTATLPPGCQEDALLVNGGFEDDSGWIFGDDPVRPEYSAEHFDGGLRSVRLGNPPGPDTRNVKTYSSLRQPVTLPNHTGTARLTWQFLSRSQEGNNPSPGDREDRQDVIVLGPDLSTWRILYRARVDSGAWQSGQADLTPFMGQTITIYFNVFNDGNGARTWMYLDDVRLTLCYPTPVALATATGMAISAAPVATMPVPTSTPTIVEAGPVAGMATGETEATEADVRAFGMTPEPMPSVLTSGVATPNSSEPIEPERSIPVGGDEGSGVQPLWQRFLALSSVARWAIAVGILVVLYLFYRAYQNRSSPRSRP